MVACLVLRGERRVKLCNGSVLAVRDWRAPARAACDAVRVEVKSRFVTVNGPRGELKRGFRHLPLQMALTKDKKRVRVAMYGGTQVQIAALRTVCTHLKNMFVGVTKAFEYKMRFVYAHFPINLNITDNNQTVEIRNFLGEKRVRTVKMLPGVTCEKTQNVKDEIALRGNDLELVSRSGKYFSPSCFSDRNSRIARRSRRRGSRGC